jgi:uncharacterized membrane protein
MPLISLFILFALSLFFIAMLQVHIFEVAFAKLGLTPETTLLLLIGTLVGSGINLPLFNLRIKQTGDFAATPEQRAFWELFRPVKEGKVVIAVNVGGCIIPLGLCLYFISLHLFDPVKLLISLPAITALSYKFSRVLPGVGVGLPMFMAPLASASLALILDPEHAAHLAYISGVLGVLIGADLLRLKNISELGAPIAVIGGAGTFDGIFLTGIIAAILA